MQVMPKRGISGSKMRWMGQLGTAPMIGPFMITLKVVCRDRPQAIKHR
ncbi:hypothetical protein CBM2588_A40061 [Cupriavidus taiwanensis]|nr:hypothetical protein CBM2588_A40061 [Cupriavidus taiwanensis]